MLSNIDFYVNLRLCINKDSVQFGLSIKFSLAPYYYLILVSLKMLLYYHTNIVIQKIEFRINLK